MLKNALLVHTCSMLHMTVHTSHSFNLIAHVMQLRLRQILFIKKAYYSKMGKCSAMWNKWSHSVHAAELIKEELTVSFMIPNDTRWNSQYDALDQLRVTVSEPSGEVKLRTVCEQLGIAAYRPTEISFLSEYC